ncbi:hypothetical protein OSB04_un001698 [Centaurea solstitialis]|uniref:Retrotransposon gag domain-containing protein n=1 Tax=Centaurea solstitialis TaxID=347529 RepID=A0AA38W2E3_9ASTR|nr:hypothetical protein OSB04_un001698 [Centaurea solstitialis]
MEVVFDMCKCADEDKVVYAQSMLKVDALHQWNSQFKGRGSEMVKTLTWERFVMRFKTQFYPMAVTKKLEEEFLELEHGNSTVQEYTARFIKRLGLLRFMFRQSENGCIVHLIIT